MTSPESSERLIAGRYRLRRLIGQGSMGLVWEAFDEHLRRPVAVKQVRQLPGVPRAEADELRERTLREARAIAVLAHPNVVTLHDVVREHDEPFVVMEYVPAASLAQLLRINGPLDTTQAAVVADAVAAGLQAAHRAGITHRDVKPGNVLVGTDGRVKLTDFGIARNVSERTLTRSGVMLGSPAYIAPEIASGGEVTPAADLWGLGATLFAAVEGAAPYDPDAPVLDTLHRVVDGEVPLPEHDGPLREVITGLMTKDPAARMPLSRVRELVHPLQPAPGRGVFASLRTDPADAPTVVTRPVPPPPPPQAPGEASVPLAPAPGPLPFLEARRTAPRTRGILATAVLTVLAIALFSAAAGGGFALARVAGGQSVLPESVPAPSSVVAPPVRDLTVRTADASTLAGEQGGAFTVPVPTGWVKFVEQRTSETLPNSTRIHWVSPDGTSELVVERFPGFYPDHAVETYLQALAFRTPGYRLVSSTALEPDRGDRPELALQLTYRSVDSADDVPDSETTTDLSRTTFANVLPTGTDLWVVGMSVPLAQEDTGRSGLFAQMAPEFRILG